MIRLGTRGRAALTFTAGLLGASLVFFSITSAAGLPYNPVARFAGTALELAADAPAARGAVEAYLDDKYGWAPGEDYIVESVSPVMDLWDADRLVSANPIDVSPGYVGLFRAVVSRGGAEFPVVVDPKIAREGVRSGKCPGADGFQVGDIRALVERDAFASCESLGVRPLAVEFHACGGVAYGRLEEGGPYAALASESHYEYSDYYEENMGSTLGFKVNAGPAVTSDTARVLVLLDDDVPSSVLAGIAGEFGTRASSAGPGAGGRLLLVLASVPDGVSREVLSRLAGDFDNGFDFANQKDARVLKKDLAGLDALPDYVDNGYQYVFAYEDLASAMVCWNSEGGWTSCVL